MSNCMYSSRIVAVYSTYIVGMSINDYHDCLQTRLLMWILTLI